MYELFLQDPRTRPAVTDKVYPDDGRSSDGRDHGGDWRSHTRADRIAETDDRTYTPPKPEQPIWKPKP